MTTSKRAGQFKGQPDRGQGEARPSDARATNGRLQPVETKERPAQARERAANNKSANNKYETILRAAIKVFARNGFFSSKVADIAKEAGVADGTVYLYFKNKDDILVSIFNHVVDEALEKGRARLGRVNDPVEIVKQIATAHLERFAGDRDLAIVFQAELRSSTKFMEQFSATGVTEYLELIRAAIQAGQKTGVFRKEINSTLMAKILFGALDEMVTNWVLSKKKYSLVATGEVVLDVFFNGIATK
jgi:TetR/AcrR family fatty acid metabolism transcriptional regulator